MPGEHRRAREPARRGLLLAASLAPALAVIALAAGCESPFNRQNFDAIRIGVHERADVRQRIGTPRSPDDADEWYYQSESSGDGALVHFGRDGKVSAKEWLGGGAGKSANDGTLGGDVKRVLGLD